MLCVGQRKKTHHNLQYFTPTKKSHLENLGDRHEAIGDAAKESVHATQIVNHVVHQQHTAARAVLLQQLRLTAGQELRVQGLGEREKEREKKKKRENKGK